MCPAPRTFVGVRALWHPCGYVHSGLYDVVLAVANIRMQLLALHGVCGMARVGGNGGQQWHQQLHSLLLAARAAGRYSQRLRQ
jgi:hypothetical protein